MLDSVQSCFRASLLSGLEPQTLTRQYLYTINCKIKCISQLVVGSGGVVEEDGRGEVMLFEGSYGLSP